MPLGKLLLAGLAFVAVTTASAAEEGHLPLPCAEIAYPPPPVFRCPTPYVEMAHSGTATVFERAWHCRETGHSLGQVSGGCGGGHGLAMFPGWTVPDGKPAANDGPDIRAEVIEYAFRPCAGLKYDSDPSMKQSGIDRAAFVDLSMAIMPKEAIDSTVEQIESLNIEGIAQRKLFYSVVLKSCVGGGAASN